MHTSQTTLLKPLFLLSSKMKGKRKKEEQEEEDKIGSLQWHVIAYKRSMSMGIICIFQFYVLMQRITISA